MTREEEYWLDRLPKKVAAAQAAWVKRERIKRAIKAGATIADIARALKISKSLVSELKWRSAGDSTAPILAYFRPSGDLALLADTLKKGKIEILI